MLYLKTIEKENNGNTLMLDICGKYAKKMPEKLYAHNA